MLSFFLGVSDPDLGEMRSVIIVGLVYGIIIEFLNSPCPLLLLPPPPKPLTPTPTIMIKNANRKAATLAKKQRPW